MISGVKKRKIRIGAVELDAVSFDELLVILDKLVEDPQTDYVVFCEAHLCVRATREPEIRNVLDQASLVLPDGVAMTAGARLIGECFPNRLPGPTVMLEYCHYGLRKHRKHFLYGGSEGVAERLALRLREMFPGIEIVGIYSPPFRTLSPEEEENIRKRIESSGAEVLWVGLGAPKQEYWMAAHKKQINVPLMLGVGAAFDFHSGNRRWAPVWIRKIGMEWFYRMFTGGRRVFIRNLKYESAFTWLIMKQAIGKRLGFDKSAC
jgi:N-acetylglucosaminyldiphosphoundecaprenol N-acetyl-beta-D-mannosaminyltransferase